MRYRYTFDVVSRVYLDPPMHFAHRGFTFRLLTKEQRLAALVVETPSAELPQGWTPKADESPSVPTLASPPEPYLPLVQQEVRAIRGALTLWGLLDIDVDQPKKDFIPETPAEQEELDMLGIHLKRRPRTDLPMIPAAPDMPVRCILARSEFAAYELPFEFYRRGSDDCYHSHFVEAIFNFFFVLEYLFGGGKFKTAQLEGEFLKSSQLETAVIEAQQTMAARELSSCRWAPTATAKYVRRSFSEVINLIVELRGFLHHQSLKRRKNWNPGVQAEFEADAHFLSFLCQSVLMKPALDILFAPEAKGEFLATPVFGANNQQIRWNPQTLN